MKAPKFYIILVAISILIFILVEALRERPVDWSPSFSSFERMPYGTYALYELLPDLFPGKTIRKNHENYYQMLNDISLNNESLIIIASKFMTDQYSMNAMLEYIKEGHQVLISALEFDKYLMDTLGINVQIVPNGIKRGKQVMFNFEDSLLKTDSGFYYQFPMYSFFVKNENVQYKVLGSYKNHKVNFIQFDIGEGKLFLNTVPLAFTNYNILKGFTRSYVEQLFSMMAVNNIIWDEHLRHVEIQSTSPLRYVLSVKTLRIAFLILLLLIILYFLFTGKRRQQMVPLVVPLENSTHRFIQTLGRLYLYRNNHKDIAKKKIRYFTESVKSSYSLKIKEFDEKFVVSFSKKSGISEEVVSKLVSLIRSIELKNEINKDELFELNMRIDECLKK